MSPAPTFPRAARYVVVGAGVHGLSTAWHLAAAVTTDRRGGHGDVVVLDKTGIGAGASGIACGVIRNNYFQPAMRRLMAHSVSIWESDPASFAYHPVGYVQAACESMHAAAVQVHAEQAEIGYPSDLVEDEAACRSYLHDLFDDWQAPGITSVLHEHRGGYANNKASLRGLAAKAEAAGAGIYPGVRVTGFDLREGAVHAVLTDHGTIACEQVVIAAGPWIRDLWAMLELPEQVNVRDRHGQHADVEMWRYLQLQEGTLRVDPATFTDARGGLPPVMHVDSDAPLYDRAGRLVTDQLWGIYYKPDFAVGGVQGGTVPLAVGKPAAEVAVDPYGPASPEFTVDDAFRRMWPAALAHCHRRFAGAEHRVANEPSGGLGCFTPDSFPVFDTFRQNAYVIADSNHGYKLIGVGALVAAELLGEPQDLLAPFRFSRYQRGELHPTSASPFPWS
jgi:glycine/D-amino acid oxidase-like deaminating enzyme